MKKPVVYIASPYTRGETDLNVHFACKTWEELRASGLVTPLAPLWSHLQQLVSPLSYAEWVAHDNEIIDRCCDACLRVDATCPAQLYTETTSPGADAEVELFRSLRRPVFFSTSELFAWAVGDWWFNA